MYDYLRIGQTDDTHKISTQLLKQSEFIFMIKSHHRKY